LKPTARSRQKKPAAQKLSPPPDNAQCTAAEFKKYRREKAATQKPPAVFGGFLSCA
jgi:hypothetical protein